MFEAVQVPTCGILPSTGICPPIQGVRENAGTPSTPIRDSYYAPQATTRLNIQHILTRAPLPATSAVADVRHSPPPFERRGRPGSNQAHRIVRSSQRLVLVSTPKHRQAVELAVSTVCPASALIRHAMRKGSSELAQGVDEQAMFAMLAAFRCMSFFYR